jgi:hypothetical protein
MEGRDGYVPFCERILSGEYLLVEIHHPATTQIYVYFSTISQYRTYYSLCQLQFSSKIREDRFPGRLHRIGMKIMQIGAKEANLASQ